MRTVYYTGGNISPECSFYMYVFDFLHCVCTYIYVGIRYVMYDIPYLPLGFFYRKRDLKGKKAFRKFIDISFHIILYKFAFVHMLYTMRPSRDVRQINTVN